MDILIEYTKLSRNIINIIEKYKNNRFEDIMKTFIPNNENDYFRLKTGITIKDIIILCIQKGFIGFYLDNTFENKSVIDNLKRMMKNENIEKSIFCRVSDKFYQVIISHSNYKNYKLAPLARINCWNETPI